jgi:hypothetical protein
MHGGLKGTVAPDSHGEKVIIWFGLDYLVRGPHYTADVCLALIFFKIGRFRAHGAKIILNIENR